MKKGDILLVPFPFTDLSALKIRPSLVLAERVSDIILAFITTKLSWIDDNDLFIKAGKDNGLKHDSVLKLGKIVTIDKILIKGRLGSLNYRQLNQIDKKLITILQINL